MEKEKILELNAFVENQMSPTFCMAKFHYPTITLQTWETHSCHHTNVYQIPLEEVEKDPAALHNSSEAQRQRKKMLSGKWLSWCQYCNNIESMGKWHVSDRNYRNASIYTKDRLDQIKKEKHKVRVNPQYIEVSFWNQCNFKCWYCHPRVSSSFWNEIETFGPYKNVENMDLDTKRITLWKDEDTNPYVKAWWKWWPELRKTLRTLRVTWGEPLLQKSTWNLLESISNNPLSDLNFHINTNLWIDNILVKKLNWYIKEFITKKKIKDFRLYTSIDTWWKKAEYIRTWLDIKVWEKNLDSYITTTWAPLHIMITYNMLSVTSFTELLKKILEWRSKYNTPRWMQKIDFDIIYLYRPSQYDMHLLPKDEYVKFAYDSLEFMKENLEDWNNSNFSSTEYNKFKRVVDYMANSQYSKEKLINGRADFYNWFKEFDKRRNTDFASVFPEYTEFMNQCRKVAQVREYLKYKKKIDKI